jgi:hypothetical protein
MLGLIYLLLTFTFGYVICSYAFPGLDKLTYTDYSKRKISVSPYWLLLPAWYITGTLAVTWATYLVAYVFSHTEHPLLFANSIVMPIALVVSVLGIYHTLRKGRTKLNLISKDKRSVQVEYVVLTAIVLLACILMWSTFYVKGDKLYIGVTVFSDFSPHLGMIRSFSYGNNVPTWYSHFAGEDIKYHFMFQFLVGNLEYLGLRLDYAFNLPSILSFISAFLLLYLLTVKITGKIGAGILACLFFAFRSSKTLFTYLAGIPKGTNLWQSLSDNMEFISDTPNENWGLWNLNVYCNQRHLAIGLAVIFFILILYIPYLYDMLEKRKEVRLQNLKHSFKGNNSFFHSIIESFHITFFTKDVWKITNIRQSVAAGLILGSLSFFHGSAVIACLLILFIIAVLSTKRLDFLITAIITLCLTLLQSRLFIHGSAVKPELLFGFIAEQKTIFGVLSYLERLLGILPFVLLAALCIEKNIGRYLMLAFSAPIIFAFTVSLTVDVTVNHKFIMMSCILYGIFAASVIMKLFEKRDILNRLIGLVLIIMLTATGVYDFTTVLKKNNAQSAIVLEMDHPLTKWVNANSDARDIFLTSNYAINQLVFGGAMLYEGWQYFPWSAGYNTDTRTEQVRRMYEASSPQELEELVKANHIRFIVIDYDNRTSEEYEVNEDNIRSTYELVYKGGSGEAVTNIYDTHKRIKK